MKAQISGSEGTVYLTPRWHETQEYCVKKNDKLEKVQLPTRGKGYEYEIEEVHQCLRMDKIESDLWSLKHTSDLIRIMDEIRKQTGVVFPFEQ